MVVKFDKAGKVLLTLGRRPEAVGEVGSSAGSGVYGRSSGPPGSGVPGDNFNQPTDVAFDAAGNIFVSDGYVNNRIAKFDKNGEFIKSWGATGSENGQFNTAHSIAVDSRGNVYVADMGNKRIQVFDNNGTFKSQIGNVGATRAICISPGDHQYIYSSNSNPTEDPFQDGEIHKKKKKKRWSWTARWLARSARPASSSRSSAWSMRSTAAIPTTCMSPSS